MSPGANIGDRSRACETRPFLWLEPCVEVNSFTYVRAEYSTHCVVFVSLFKIIELYIISKSHGRAVLKKDHHCPCAAAEYIYILLILLRLYRLSLRPSAMKAAANRSMVYTTGLLNN